MPNTDRDSSGEFNEDEVARLISNTARTNEVGSIVKTLLAGPNLSKELLAAKFEAAKEAVVRFVQGKYAQIRKYAKEHPYKFTAIVILIILACAAGPIAASALSAAGFTSAGVAAGSAAAAWHSSIGIVAAGSVFSTLQSIAVTGAVIGIGYAVFAPLAGLGIWKLAGGTTSGAVESIKNVGSKAVEAAGTVVNTVAVGGMIAGAMVYQRFLRWRNG